MTPSNQPGRSGRMRITDVFREFFQSQQASGIILVAVTAASLLISNSIGGNEYRSFWDIHFRHRSLRIAFESQHNRLDQ